MFHQKSAAMVATVTALLLVTIKVVVGLATGTLSLIASAVDSAFDLIVSLFNYFVLRMSGMPSDEQYNYGRGKLEAMASIIEGVIIFISACAIFTAAMVRLATEQAITRLPAAAWTMGVSLIVTFCLVAYLRQVVKRTRNTVIAADVVHYKADLLSNAGILVSLLLIQWTGWIVIDALVSIAVAGYLIYATVPLMKNGYFMLMDRALDPVIVDQIKSRLDSETRLNSYHALRTRQSADIYFVDVHLVFDKQISLLDAHAVADRIAIDVRKLDQRQWVINMHLDPVDDSNVEKLHAI